MRLRLIPVTVACALAALIFPLIASAEPRMLIGFQDDPEPPLARRPTGRLRSRAEGERGNRPHDRLLVAHRRDRPANAPNPFDPAYRFDDLDEFVRNAGLHGMEVMLTIWGTPHWANGGKGQNYRPDRCDRPAELRAGARVALLRPLQRLPVRRATTRSGTSRTSGSSSRRSTTRRASRSRRRSTRGSTAPRTPGSRPATPAPSSASARRLPRGRDHLLGRQGTQETESPGKFAQLLAAAEAAAQVRRLVAPPVLRPRRAGRRRRTSAGRTSTLAQLPRFEDTLQQLVRTGRVPIWITEYGYETKPGEPKGVTLGAAGGVRCGRPQRSPRDDPNVQMFIWFILRDDPTSAWQSGLVDRDGTKKPSFNAFATLAYRYDARNPQIIVRAGVDEPDWSSSLRSSSGHAPEPGRRSGMTIAVYDKGKVIKTAQPVATIGADGWVSFRAPLKTVKGHNYIVTIKAGDVHGNQVNRSVLVRSSAASRVAARPAYSTVTVFARFRGWSTFRPRSRAIR